MPSADQSGAPDLDQSLPDPLPADPLAIFKAWFDEAATKRVQPNPNAMSLATIDPDGTPSVRMVLCKEIDLRRGFLVFYTNYRGRKGRALAANPRAAVAFHWDALDRQVRIEGPVTQSPAGESDAYFAGRPLISRLAAWASDQSEPIVSRAALRARLRSVEERFGVRAPDPMHPDERSATAVPRPAHWGGMRLWAARVELWVGGTGRLHDRAGWNRALEPSMEDGAPGFVAKGIWKGTRLQP
jgi:pyridoxamine 5'-phosphate oxidase